MSHNAEVKCKITSLCSEVCGCWVHYWVLAGVGSDVILTDHIRHAGSAPCLFPGRRRWYTHRWYQQRGPGSSPGHTHVSGAEGKREKMVVKSQVKGNNKRVNGLFISDSAHIVLLASFSLSLFGQQASQRVNCYQQLQTVCENNCNECVIIWCGCVYSTL